MSNFAIARTSMVDSQIHTAGVISDAVLHAFLTVPRELFVPENLRGHVYADEDLDLGDGRFLMEPAILARMIEAANVRGQDVILNVGDSTGYSSAVLTMLAKTVTPLEKAAPGEVFSLIVLNGAAAEFPPALLDGLALQGRMIGIVRPAGERMGTVTITEKIAEKHYSTRKLFEAGTPYIPGYEPKPAFTF